MPGRDKNTRKGTGSSPVTLAKDETPQPAPTHEPRPGAKNRPTPKRKDQEAARRRPLVPADREAAKKADKEHAREARRAQREAAARGDQAALPTRDRGPERAYIRDRVDARLSLGEIAIPLMLVAVVTAFIPNIKVQSIGLGIVWLIVLAGFIDCALMWRTIKKGVVAKFGAAPKGSARYAWMRAFQMRRTRFPAPRVKRGDTVD